MFAMARGQFLFASAFVAIGALFAYLLVHHFLSDQLQRAIFVATIYIGSFVVIGALAKAFLAAKLSDVNLHDIQNQAGPSRQRRLFLLGGWCNEESSWSAASPWALRQVGRSQQE
jgi:hypothetical protein